ncbi:MAG TPA: hypothetical protein VLF90_02445 [Patescibacteria group bacterium]|nr:hypothetical protein [Patescibacteria group bacterium]
MAGEIVEISDDNIREALVQRIMRKAGEPRGSFRSDHLTTGLVRRWHPVVLMPEVVSQSPTLPEVVALELTPRLVSSGGRPTDPDWTIYRPIPMKPETWDTLRQLAVDASSEQRHMNPAQVAAFLLERAIEPPQV